jgi:hypothetical protein
MEGFAVLVSAIALYWQLTAGPWWLFLLLLLSPDLSMLAYMINKRWGAIGYNLVHTYIGPLLLIGISLFTQWTPGAMVGFIWLAHIGMDRTVGYGLKYATDFKDTHLGRV